VGSRRDCTWILGLPGFRVVTTTSDGDRVDSRLTIRIEYPMMCVTHGTLDLDQPGRGGHCDLARREKVATLTVPI